MSKSYFIIRGSMLTPALFFHSKLNPRRTLISLTPDLQNSLIRTKASHHTLLIFFYVLEECSKVHA